MKNTSDKPSSGILRQKAEDLLKKKSEARILELIEELANQNEEKTKRADKLIFVNKELVFEQENLRKIASLVPGVVYQYLLRPDGTSCFPYASEAIREMYRVSPDEVREDASEEKLKQVSARAELAARAGGVGIWDYDIVNDILLWDDQMFALYGITGKEFIGVYEAWQAGVHPDDKERGDKEIQMAILSEKEFDTEFRVVWPDNSIHNIRALAVVQHDDSGKALRMIGTNWDITELRKAE
ncbi:MAG: PAS domain-containing protein, partial [Bacteroidales bacterium]